MDSIVISLSLIIIICMFLSILFFGLKKGLIFSSVLILIVLCISTYFVLKDVSNIQKNIMIKDKLFVLMDDKHVVSAFSFSSLENITSNNTIRILKDAQLKSVESDLDIGYTRDLKKEYYKIIVLKKDMFNETLENGLSYDFGGQTLEIVKEDFEEVISSSDPSEILMDKLNNIQGINLKNIPPEMIVEAKKEIYKKMNIESSEQLKGYAFMILIADFVKEKGAIEFVYSFRNDEIEVYPKTAVFRLIEIVPESLINKTVQKVITDKEVT